MSAAASSFSAARERSPALARARAHCCRASASSATSLKFRSVSSAEREASVGLVGPLLETQYHRLRHVGYCPPSTPILATGDDLAAAVDVHARLVQAPRLGLRAREVGKYPQLEIAGTALVDDPPRALERLGGPLGLPAQRQQAGGQVV